jgi:hypothetical protein
MNVALALRPDFTIAMLTGTHPMRFPERKKLWVEGLRMAGMPKG